MELPEPLEDRVLGFIWRWLWRIVFWGVAAVVALIAFLYLLSWASAHPERWGLAMIAGLLGGIFVTLNEVRKLAARLVEQNAEMLARTKPNPSPSYDFDD